MKKLLPAIIVAVLALSLSSCEVITPTQQAEVPWPTALRSTVGCIAHFESGGRADAVSPGSANDGILQINRVHAADFQAVTGHPWNPGVFDPYLNGLYAHHLWLSAGWSAWSTHRLCGV